MEEIQKLVVYRTPEASKVEAETLANKLKVPLWEEPGPELSLKIDESGLSLIGYGLSFQGDFAQMLGRLSKAKLPQEMLVHVARTKIEHPTAADCTAGMGEDSILLAAAGYEVTLFEQNPVIAALLGDALKRGQANPDLQPIVSRMHLVEGNSIEILKQQPMQFDLIYLDPMFPARKKSGLINKKLQLIQKLEQPCSQEEELMETVLSLHPGKIVVKRPLKGPFLADKKPGYSSKGKAIRYDCYINC